MMHTELFGLGRARLYQCSLRHHSIYGSSRFRFERLFHVEKEPRPSHIRLLLFQRYPRLDQRLS